ncbi:MAG: NADH-quinone oxidoreductase subunit N [Acidobacteria bacterium]|nr:NADH-quinone oxidoreductase subunit N [Acidobacteriota bacterium]
MTAFYTGTDHFAVLPALLLALFGCAVLLFEFVLPVGMASRRALAALTLAGEGFTAYSLYRQHSYLSSQGWPALTAFQGAVTIDGLALAFNWMFLAAAGLAALISYRYLETEGEHSGEYYGLLLFAQFGMFFLASGTDLIVQFTGLETMALSFYVLVGFLRGRRRSNEAALKYFVLGVLSSGLILYGFSVLYGISGSTKLSAVAGAVAGRGAGDPLIWLAVATLGAGLFFKIAAAPFHMWAPDAYDGGPTPVVAYLSVASKAAAFVLLLRLFLGPLAAAREAWQGLTVMVALASLAVGTIAALSQDNVKRLLAYSSIAHGGYVLLGLVAGNARGLQGIVVYLLTYVFMNTGAFLVLVLLRRGEAEGNHIDDLSGLMRRSPAAAVLMLLFLLSLGGLPPSSGFIAKYYIFLALVESGHYALAAVGAIFAAAGLYYYFRLVKTMFGGRELAGEPLAASMGTRVAMVSTAVVTLGLGLYPEPLLQLALLPVKP